MSDDFTTPDPLAPWPTLTERDAGSFVEAELYEDVPPHLERDLISWVSGTLSKHPDLSRAVLNRFRVSWHTLPSQNYSHHQIAIAIMRGELTGISSPRPVDRLSLLDAIIALHPTWNMNVDDPFLDQRPRIEWIERLGALQALLRDTGSAWHVVVEPPLRGLYRRVDPTATEAWRLARKSAETEGYAAAAANLATAWHQIYGRNPDPTAGYSAAVKAVEAVAVPVLAPGTGTTVHAAERTLRKALEKDPASWRFVLLHEPGLAPGTGTADVVSNMLHRLVTGETGRHTSAAHNRPSTQAEAEAAVHLAVTLVQWFATGAVQPRP